MDSANLEPLRRALNELIEDGWWGTASEGGSWEERCTSGFPHDLHNLTSEFPVQRPQASNLLQPLKRAPQEPTFFWILSGLSSCKKMETLHTSTPPWAPKEHHEPPVRFLFIAPGVGASLSFRSPAWVVIRGRTQDGTNWRRRLIWRCCWRRLSC